MYQDYDRAAGKVIEYLTQNNYASSVIYMNKRCFRLLKKYMAENNVAYSQEIAIYWLAEDSIRNLCSTIFRNYRLALFRLNDVLEERQFATLANRPLIYRYLTKKAKDLLDSFLGEISKKYCTAYVRVICISVTKFLNYLAKRGVEEPTEITHRLIFDYYQDDIYRSQKSKNQSNRNVRVFLRYLVGKKLIKDSIVAVLDPLAIKRLFFIDQLPVDEKTLFFRYKQAKSMTPDNFHSMAMQLDNNCLDQYHYSLTMRKIFRKTWKELFVFLEANELEYSPHIALCWATHLRHYTIQWQAFRRGIKIFEQYRHNGDINPAIVYSYKKDRAEYLPEWCKKEYKDFMIERQREGFALSTLHMYRNSCLRFIGYLSQSKIIAWNDISLEIIKNFHLSDPHSTSEGKNAYASKIRIFLEYLGNKGFVAPFLYLALSTEHAPRVNIIKILNENELKAIYNFLEQAQTGIELRNAAIIMLGLRMGIRASDITKLKLADISWDKSTISIQQKKTDKFLKLPIPIDVGNALYKYIMNGRPTTVSEYVFVTHRVPYDKLHRSVCKSALKNVLPGDPHGFNITRKTFASRMLVNSTEPETIAEALGHSDSSTVMTYLATDGKSMRQCAVSLKGIEVKGGMLL